MSDSPTMLRRNLRHALRYPSMTVATVAGPVLILRRARARRLHLGARRVRARFGPARDVGHGVLDRSGPPRSVPISA
jgi:hypothetical protein